MHTFFVRSTTPVARCFEPRRRDGNRASWVEKKDPSGTVPSEYEKLADYYKEAYSELNRMNPGDVDHMNKLDLKSREELDTYEELKAETKKLLEQYDLRSDAIDIYNQKQEARYGELFADLKVQNYEELKEFYKELHKTLNGNDQEPSLEELDTFEKLKPAVYELWRQAEQRDPEFKDFVEKNPIEITGDQRDAHYQELDERYAEMFGLAEFQNQKEVEDFYKVLHKNVRGEEPSMEGLDTYQELKLGVYQLWEERDRQHDLQLRERLHGEKDESHADDSAQLHGIDSDKDTASESIEDAGEDVGDPYGYGDYFGW